MNKIEIFLGDITKLEVDAIVNAANTTLLGGGGVDGAIHKSAGKQLLEECKTLGGCKMGEAKITKAYNLPAKYVIHTVGPIWTNGYNEPKVLENCYKNSLKLLLQYELKTIAFPSISTGAYRFPIETASKIAIDTVIKFIKCNNNFIDKVYFVCFSRKDFDIYNNIYNKII